MASSELSRESSWFACWSLLFSSMLTNKSSCCLAFCSSISCLSFEITLFSCPKSSLLRVGRIVSSDRRCSFSFLSCSILMFNLFISRSYCDRRLSSIFFIEILLGFGLPLKGRPVMRNTPFCLYFSCIWSLFDLKELFFILAT